MNSVLGAISMLWSGLRKVEADTHTSAIILLWFVIAVVLAGLLWPGGKGRRLARQIYAVSVLGFREGLRMKVLWTVFALAVIPGTLAYFSDGDGTHAGRARLLLDACLSTGEVLGATLIVLLCALSLAREIENRIMHTLGTKPVPRWAILAGKALGFWAVDIMFLAGLTLFTGLLVWMVPLRAETRKIGTLVDSGTWTVPLRAETPKIGTLVDSGTWEDLRRNALITRTFIRADDEAEKPGFKFIKPGESFAWNFTLNPDSNRNDPLALRVLLSSTSTFASHINNVRLVVGYTGQTPFLDRVMTLPQDRPQELFIDPKYAAQGGVMSVSLTAEKPGRGVPSIVAQRPGAVELGVTADGFGANMLKSFLLMATQGWILALITTGWSGVLSFPVTVALGAILVLGGELSRQAADLLQTGASHARAIGDADPGMQRNVLNNLQLVLLLLPDFRSSGSPAAFADGKFLSGWLLAWSALWMGVVRGFGWALPGVLFFRFREVGK